jgi:hypothetical protein
MSQQQPPKLPENWTIINTMTVLALLGVVLSLAVHLIELHMT